MGRSANPAPRPQPRADGADRSRSAEQPDVGDILSRVKPQIDAIALPHGYSIEWGGDAENSSEAQQGLFTTLPLGYW